MRQKHKRRQAPLATYSLVRNICWLPPGSDHDLLLCFCIQRIRLLFGGWLSVIISPDSLFCASVETPASSSFSVHMPLLLHCLPGVKMPSFEQGWSINEVFGFRCQNAKPPELSGLREMYRFMQIAIALMEFILHREQYNIASVMTDLISIPELICQQTFSL